MPFKTNSLSRWLAAVVLLVALGLTIRILPLRDWLSFFADWVQNRGASGIAIFMAVYVLGVVLLLPSAGFTAASALAFGFWRGLFIAAASASVGAVLSFLIARYFARDTVRKWVAKNEKLNALDGIISENDWKIVFLCRLTPFVPFVVSNYFFGLTRLHFWPYFFASTAGILPGALFYTYVGYIGKVTLTEPARERTTQEYVFLGLGLLMTILFLVYISFRAKKALQQKRTLATAEK